ncbi:TATA box-binding protein-associated factor RNA polymerase I subunit B-like isoform X2 [Phragmites australis]|uniref:TATA box-binding protein-associated factor RNA polymerase I subunit B-like isoform X2 n=1 Tax=Phragmites australis TaxID=29695 RepID=UPI002D777E2F|nr:TATA box-binding protein-associated factor RNA polymerase I subunit B-like isoform X2 [Phragmites australis]
MIEDENPKEQVKSQSQGHDAMQMIKSEMQDRGFHYMPPKKPRKSDGYLRYRRRLTGGFIYVVHADYYMLLRAFAKLAEVDVRIMHTSVLKLEKRLPWIEEQIERSLNTLQNLSSRTKDELRPLSG